MATLTRDQQRATHAYACVQALPANLRDDYKILVNDLGAHIMRSGLSATLSFMERSKSAAARAALLKHLADAKVPHLEGAKGPDLPEKVRALPVDRYMLVTREILKLTVWFRRAVQA